MQVFDKLVIACVDGGSTLNILRQDLFMELDKEYDIELWRPPIVMVSAFGQRSTAKVVTELEIVIDVFRKKLPFYVSAQASDPMILGMDFTLGCVSGTKTGIRGEPRLEIPVSERETISVPTRVSYRAVTEEVRTALADAIQLAPGELRSLSLATPRPRETGIPPERVELACKRILPNGVEQISVVTPNERTIITCLINETGEWQQVDGGLWAATYIHPKPVKLGHLVEEVDAERPGPPQQVVQRGETLRSAWTRRVSTELSGHNPVYDIDVESPPEYRSLLVGELTHPEAWPNWQSMSPLEWRSSVNAKICA